MQSLTFSPSGREYAVSVMGNAYTDLFETKSGKTLRRLSQKLADTYALAYSPDERLFASAMADRTQAGESAIIVRVRGLPAGDKRLDLLGAESDVLSLAFSPNGKLLAGGQRNGQVRVWSVENGNCVAKLDRYSGEALAIFASGGEELISTGKEGGLLVWNTRGFKVKKTLTLDSVRYIDISYSGMRNELYAADELASVQVWANPRWRREKTVKFTSTRSGINPLFAVAAIAPDARLVAATDGAGVSVWEITTGKRVGQYKHSRGYEVKRLSITPDGKMLLSGASHLVSGETEVSLWNLK